MSTLDINTFPVIAGPCSAESREQTLSCARRLKEIGVRIFRAGIWKPRTRPGCFEGVGAEGLGWLSEVQRLTGMRAATEVACREHVEACLASGIGVLWLGARTTANPFLVEEISEAMEGSGVTVLVKNPVSPDVNLWAGAVERLRSRGIREIIAVHRGVPSPDSLHYRNAPRWQMSVEFRRRFPEVPIYCDPSHIAGQRAYVAEIAQKALDLGLDGLMVEVHEKPSAALSDADQQLDVAGFKAMLDVLTPRSKEGGDELFHLRLEEHRTRLDEIDESLVKLLSDRMQASKAIGELKKEAGVAIVQSGRWGEVLKRVRSLAAERNLDPEFVNSIFNLIHEESVSVQNLSEK